MSFKTISAEPFAVRQRQKSVDLIDVRTPVEFREVQVQGAGFSNSVNIAGGTMRCIEAGATMPWNQIRGMSSPTCSVQGNQS